MGCHSHLFHFFLTIVIVSFILLSLIHRLVVCIIKRIQAAVSSVVCAFIDDDDGGDVCAVA